ncbi:ankyrin repeat-containing protein NPR4-like [Diospyros lotus]|uniref:ankyrin repeat-containing protein NPR4-like n=1 Tax=Diospyros lotus TaxID=55363 RepID=UPI0022534A65|nr:ankyrin repeat-containing protein NPR4-like [Diospyros lotus]
MQRELQRFKEVEKMAPMCKGLVNNKNQTPKDLFDKEHNDLKNQGRDWLKEIATSCSVVATLIVTIMFAAAFTAPGGYKEDTGMPTYLRSKYFSAYIISDAFSLFFSCTSAMIFLGIHTSLFREEDFLIRLPLALMFGLFTLFLSIATMLVAFGTALVIMLRERFVWISIPLLMLGSIPVSIYAILHVRIFFHVLRLTFRNPTN